MKQVGILMPVASLPNTYGIGDFGDNAYKFVEYIHEMEITVWQILPLNPLGYGNSPYQPYSSYAGDELYISLDQLAKEELLEQADLVVENEEKEQLILGKYKERIHYEWCRTWKESRLRKAYHKFEKSEEYEQFCKQSWVYPYGVFSALKRKNHLICWNEWPKEEKDWILDHKYDLTNLEEEIQYAIFLQYEFSKQWLNLKRYANRLGISIMGDMPFYVGIDSLDVWENQDCFLLDKEGRPTYIAGVPPDYFSKTGQRWGNPIYNWEKIREKKFRIWNDRLAYSNKLFDIIRIDHFRAFDTYWKIPASCPTAIEGEWVEAPGFEFFNQLFEQYPDMQIVVEDLGELRPEVHKLRDYYHFKGMKVLQFSFDPKETNNDFDDKENMILYTGTHDNETLRGWYHSQPLKVRYSIRKTLWRMGYRHRNVTRNFIELSLHSVADLVVFPMQDLLNMKGTCRINVPGTLGSPNWEWKLSDFHQLIRHKERIRETIHKTRARK